MAEAATSQNIVEVCVVGRWHAGLCLALAGALLAGCASAPTREAGALEGEVRVAPGLNPNARGDPSPVFLRIYQLTERAAFDDADYWALADDDQAVLGSSMLSRDEIEICPVEGLPGPESARAGCPPGGRELELDLIADARYLAVMGEFYNLQDPRGDWRAVAEIPEERLMGLLGPGEFVIELLGSTVSVGFEASYVPRIDPSTPTPPSRAVEEGQRQLQSN